MEEERDFVTFVGDDGEEFELDIVDYFEHKGEEYAILIDSSEDYDDNEEFDAYIMKVVVNGEVEEFLPPDDELMEELAAVAEERLGAVCECDVCHDGDCQGHHECHEEGCGCHE
jgi:uncharacterized protein YrzB (UPF0473 family)